MRVPDYLTVTNKHREAVRDNFTCLCAFRECAHCHHKFHVLLPTDELVALLAAELRRNGEQLPAGAGAVHVMTNSPELAAQVQAGLAAEGYSVTASGGGSLADLMADYGAAVRADVFWGTAASSVTTNVIHARLAAGKPLGSLILWEVLWEPAAHARLEVGQRAREVAARLQLAERIAAQQHDSAPG